MILTFMTNDQEWLYKLWLQLSWESDLVGQVSDHKIYQKTDWLYFQFDFFFYWEEFQSSFSSSAMCERAETRWLPFWSVYPLTSMAWSRSFCHPGTPRKPQLQCLPGMQIYFCSLGMEGSLHGDCRHTQENVGTIIGTALNPNYKKETRIDDIYP